MGRVLNLALALLKWPLALLAVALWPVVLTEVRDNASLLALQPDRVWPFVTGAGVWLLAWFAVFRRSAWGSWLPTLLHEVAHALAAWLTLHRVIGLRASWRSGGEIEIVGAGNWFIALAPYWLPLPLGAVAVASLWTGPDQAAAVAAALGSGIAWQATVLGREIHRDQDDLQRAGWLFSACVLPIANAVVAALALAWAALGPGAAADTLIGVGRGAEVVAIQAVDALRSALPW